MWEQVFVYCERYMQPDFWAEPLNAVTNAAFLVAALMAYADRRMAAPERGGLVLTLLILLVMAMGAGSFLFHTFATRWASLADVIPIALFVFAYLALALHWFLGLGSVMSLAGGALVALAGQAMPPWLNGSLGYAPALLAMLIVGATLKARNHPAAVWVLSAVAVFTVSFALRTIDMGPGCFTWPAGAAEPQFVIGTHPFWHILNAATLYLLLRAAIDNPPAVKDAAAR
jgi:hypothetical protein